jgi:arylsulfatase A-like enzyme
MDALMARSVTFFQASSPGPWTYPSIVSLFTSKHLCSHRVLTDGQAIQRTWKTITTELQAKGYSTNAIYLNPYVEKTGIAEQFRAAGMAKHDYQATLTKNLEPSWIQPPFFLYIHSKEPHDPYKPPRRYQRKFGSPAKAIQQKIQETISAYIDLTRRNSQARMGLDEESASKRQKEKIDILLSLRQQASNLYDGEVAFADRNLLRTIRQLKNHGVWDETIFVLLADHGEELGDHGGWRHDHSVYQEMIHSPFLIRFPRDAFAGKKISTPVSLIDVVPTLLSFLGADDKDLEQWDGQNLMPLISSENDRVSESPPRMVSMRMNFKKYYRPYKESRGDINVVVRQGRWKGIWNLEPDTFELFDLSVDAGERLESSSSQPELSKRLKTLAVREFDECSSRMLRPQTSPILGPKEIEALRSLGYVN